MTPTGEKRAASKIFAARHARRVGRRRRAKHIIMRAGLAGGGARK
jgi:hypothetical protein